MRNESSIRIKLEIYPNFKLPTENNKMLEPGSSVNANAEEVEGIVVSHEKDILTIQLKIRGVQSCPSNGHTLKVRKSQSGEYEQLF